MDQRTEQTKRVATIVKERLTQGKSLKMVCKRVAKEEGMSPAAVQKCYQRCFTHPTKKHGNERLTQEQKTIIQGMILAFSGCNAPMTPQQVRETVKFLFGVTISHQTLYRWLRSLKQQVQKRKTKCLSKKRTDPWIIEECAAFVAALEESQARYAMMAHNCINYDETRLFMTSEGVARLERVDKNRSEMLGEKGELIGTFVTFVSASGSVLMSCYILKGVPTDSEGILEADFTIPLPNYQLRSRHDRFFAFSETGYLNTTLNKLIIDKFCDLWDLLYPGLHCYVFSDQLASHYCVEMVRDAFKRHVMLWSLPANTSHFAQPLDDVCFARLKQSIAAVASEIQFNGVLVALDVKANLYSAIYHQEFEIWTPRLIKRAFDNTGLFPFQPNRLLTLARQNVGIYQPSPLSLTEKAASAMSKVLQNRIDEVDQQKPPVTRKRSRVSSQCLHSPEKLCAYEDERALKKRKQEEERKMKENQKAEEKLQKQREKMKNTCLFEGCVRVRKGGKNWASCVKCGGVFCSEHRRWFLQHTLKVHTQKNETSPSTPQ